MAPLSQSTPSYYQDGLRMISFCPLCETNYNPMEARVLGEKEDGHLLHIRCKKCWNSILALVLVSNAGIAHSAPVDRMALADWERSFAVNSTGHFLVAREAMRIMKAQDLGGALVFVATKNVMSPGKDFAAYSAAKAAEAQLAKVLALEGAPHAIRSNIVNPDAVFQDSKLWSDDVRRERAAAQGISVEQLEDFYRKRNLLGARILPEDVAEAVLFLASDRASKTTGCTLTVDGGVKDAFPR